MRKIIKFINSFYKESLTKDEIVLLFRASRIADSPLNNPRDKKDIKAISKKLFITLNKGYGVTLERVEEERLLPW